MIFSKLFVKISKLSEKFEDIISTSIGVWENIGTYYYMSIDERIQRVLNSHLKLKTPKLVVKKCKIQPTTK